MSDKEIFYKRAIELLDRLDDYMACLEHRVSFAPGDACCWRYVAESRVLHPVNHIAGTSLDDLKCINRQKESLQRNTLQFINGLPANNALLWGPRGTGKSSLIKTIFNTYHKQDLRLIEVQRDDLKILPEICDLLYDREGRFIIFCDDLSFEETDPGYKAIKVILDGSISQIPENVLIYATSNRRHLMPERMSENLDSRMIDGELHLSEGIEEKLSLSERFGLWVSFHSFNQDQYLEIARYWLGKFGIESNGNDIIRKEALQWALQHGSRSGRCAHLFARDWAGKSGLAGI